MWNGWLLFLIGGALYVALEYFWRGYSHVSMFVTGGAALMLLGAALLSLSWRAAPVLLAIVLMLSLPALSGLRRVHRPVSPR